MQKRELGQLRRVESPSSINTYLQCPRKYFYSYVLSLPRKESIHTIRGKIIHSVLEDLFSVNMTKINTDQYYEELRLILINLFNYHWGENITKFLKLNIQKEVIKEFYNESLEMLNNYLYRFCSKIEQEIKTKTFSQAFELLKPKTEVQYFSERHMVQGFIDAITTKEKEVTLWDYKTSRRDVISEEYYMQLSIYALLYYEAHGVYPDYVGINFLKHTEKKLQVTNEMIEKAKSTIYLVQEKVKSNEIDDFPKHVSSLCKWKGGQCDFYDMCFGQKSLNEFVKLSEIKQIDH